MVGTHRGEDRVRRYLSASGFRPPDADRQHEVAKMKEIDEPICVAG